jgi:hypothetical protein
MGMTSQYEYYLGLAGHPSRYVRMGETTGFDSRGVVIA